MKVYCGIDWARNTTTSPLVDEAGTVIAQRRIAESSQGYEEWLTLLAEAGDTAEAPIPVAIETPRGLLVAQLRATRRRVFAASTRSAPRATATGTRSPARSPTGKTPSSWPTSCAPT